MQNKNIYACCIKRPLDFLLAICAFVFLSPLLLLLILMVRTKLGSPVFFKQERPGLNERIFKMYKFRTMTDEKDCKGNLLPDSDRLTKFGKFLRATSLDELPELLNIIKGDMAIIGPRPLLVEYLPLYSDEQRKRHSVRPGLTGYAQVNGRNLSTWEERFSNDVYYVKHISFRLDISIFFKTIGKVLKKEGVSEAGSATKEKFKGYVK